jgi:hypothetical protein
MGFGASGMGDCDGDSFSGRAAAHPGIDGPHAQILWMLLRQAKDAEYHKANLL